MPQESKGITYLELRYCTTPTTEGACRPSAPLHGFTSTSISRTELPESEESRGKKPSNCQERLGRIYRWQKKNLTCKKR